MVEEMAIISSKKKNKDLDLLIRPRQNEFHSLIKKKKKKEKKRKEKKGVIGLPIARVSRKTNNPNTT
jgi:hypothetical protein